MSPFIKGRQRRTEEILKGDLKHHNDDGLVKSVIDDLEDAISAIEDLKFFLATAPLNWHENQVIRRYYLNNSQGFISCVFWNSLYYMTGTDIVKACMYRMEKFGRKVIERKKFEEGLFSDLRNLKCGLDATLEQPKSKFLKFLFRNLCLKTQKKQKVFFWFSIPHDKLFADALERDLKREFNGQNPTTIAIQEPALSFNYDQDSKLSLQEQLSRHISTKKCNTITKFGDKDISKNKITNAVVDNQNEEQKEANDISSLEEVSNSVNIGDPLSRSNHSSSYAYSKFQSCNTSHAQSAISSPLSPTNNLPASMDTDYSSDLKELTSDSPNFDNDDNFMNIKIEYPDENISNGFLATSLNPDQSFLYYDDRNMEIDKNSSIDTNKIVTAQFSPFLVSASLDPQYLLPHVQRTPFQDIKSAAKDGAFTTQKINPSVGNNLHFPYPEVTSPGLVDSITLSELLDENCNNASFELNNERVKISSQELSIWNMLPHNSTSHMTPVFHSLLSAGIKGTHLPAYSPFLTTTPWGSLSSPFSSAKSNKSSQRRQSQFDTRTLGKRRKTKTCSKYSSPNGIARNTKPNKVLKNSINKMIDTLRSNTKNVS